MCSGPRITRRALGLVLVGLFCLGCAPAQPLYSQALGLDSPAEAKPPLVLPTSTVSFRLTPPQTPGAWPTTTPSPSTWRQQSPTIWIGGAGSLTALSADGWQSFELSGIVRDIALDASGSAILAPGLRICDGRLLRDLLPPAPGGEQDAVAVDGQGRIWVGYYGGIAVLDGGRWNTIPLQSGTSTRARTVYDLAADSRGVIWVATGEGLVSYDGSAWQQHADKASPGNVAVQCLLIDAQDRVWLAHERGLSILRGQAWESFPLETVGFVREIVAAPAGGVLAGRLDDGILRYDGATWQPFASQESSLPSERVTALAVDGASRIWAGSHFGLCVYDQGRWLTYQEANSGLGDDHISALAISGGGLGVLPPTGPTRYGALAGQVTLRRRPVAGVRVVLCPELSAGQEFRNNPCESARFSRVAETGVDGRYLFEDVPLGHYAVAAEIEPGRWVTPMRVLSAVHYRIREGETTWIDAIEGAE